jgi:hypothetical protein
MTNDIFSHKIKLRFWNKVDNRQAGRCWNWTGAIIREGYGYFDTPYEKYAHRVSWVMHFGSIPAGMLVCHKCDNKKCINPDHLHLGTPSDNVKDRYKRFPESGRGRNYSKLTKNQAEEVLRLHEAGFSNIAISTLFNVTPQTISNIHRGNTKLFKEAL